MSGTIFLNGQFVDGDAARIDPADRGFTLADGIFDTMLAVNGVPVFAHEHFQRLCRHAAVLSLPVSLEEEKFIRAAQGLLKSGDLTNQRAAIRTTLTRGPAARGLAPPENPVPTVMMQAFPAANPATMPPIHAIIAQTTRRNEHSPLSRIKSIQYGDSFLALMEARSKGANEAILLNAAGRVACTSAASLFILEDGRLVTPPLSEGVMDGIIRALVLKNANACEDPITPDRLRAAEGVIICNSLSGLRPVAIIEGGPANESLGQFCAKTSSVVFSEDDSARHRAQTGLG